MAYQEKGTHKVNIFHTDGSNVRIYSSAVRSDGIRYEEKLEGKYPTFDSAKNSLNSDKKVYELFEKAYGALMGFHVVSVLLLGLKTFSDALSPQDFPKDFGTTAGIFFLAIISAFAFDTTSDKHSKTKNHITAVEEARKTNNPNYKGIFDL